MSEEPAAKRMKNNDEHPNMRSDVAGPVKEKLMELDQIQHQLDALSEKAAEEILKVEQNFNKKRQPVYEKRKKLTSKIECFWQTAFLNHHLLTTAIPEEQEDLLAALRDLEVQEFDDLRSGFKIIMTFDKNDYFENETITKSYHLQSETPSIEITEIQWKENRKPTERFSDQQSSPTTANLSMFCPRPDVDGSDGTITFLEWLTFAAPPDSDEIAEVIKDDLYINPLQYYIMPDMQEVDEDDLEDFLNEERGVDEIFQNGRPVLKPGESMEHDDLNDETPPEEVLEDEDEEEEEEGADGEDDGDDEEEEEEDGEEEDGEGEDDEVEDQEDQQEEEEESMKVPEGTDEETKQEDATA